jgi:KipI family sensor histidine kinase inhibitor
VIRVGEAAVLLECASTLGVLAALDLLERRPPAGLVDLVPGAETLLVLLSDPAAVDRGSLGAAEERARRAAEATSAADAEAARGGAGRVHEIPVRYDGPDLEVVARRAGLTAGEVIARHLDGRYRVAFVGFQPGFAYLTGLDRRLHCPRLDSPRTAVPAGSVAIGGEWTGIYPARSPGGWNLIGTTATRLFDPASDRPCLLLAGDGVRFVAA